MYLILYVSNSLCIGDRIDYSRVKKNQLNISNEHANRISNLNNKKKNIIIKDKYININNSNSNYNRNSNTTTTSSSRVSNNNIDINRYMNLSINLIS
jgi:hypothetical protein